MSDNKQDKEIDEQVLPKEPRLPSKKICESFSKESEKNIENR